MSLAYTHAYIYIYTQTHTQRVHKPIEVPICDNFREVNQQDIEQFDLKIRRLKGQAHFIMLFSRPQVSNEAHYLKLKCEFNRLFMTT